MSMHYETLLDSSGRAPQNDDFCIVKTLIIYNKKLLLVFAFLEVRAKDAQNSFFYIAVRLKND